MHSKAELFASTIDNCNLEDLDFFGGKFTWQKRCRGGTMISRRLDRGLGDLPWRMQFPEATVEHLIRRHSDHHPLLMRCSPVASSSVDHPFRFQAAWCTPLSTRQLFRKHGIRTLEELFKLSTISRRTPSFLTVRSSAIFLRRKGFLKLDSEESSEPWKILIQHG